MDVSLVLRKVGLTAPKALEKSPQSRRKADLMWKWWASWAWATIPWSALPFPWLWLWKRLWRSKVKPYFSQINSKEAHPFRENGYDVLPVFCTKDRKMLCWQNEVIRGIPRVVPFDWYGSGIETQRAADCRPYIKVVINTAYLTHLSSFFASKMWKHGTWS